MDSITVARVPTMKMQVFVKTFGVCCLVRHVKALG